MNYQKVPLAAGLYFVGVPIGSARDITLRALDVLASADLLAAEDSLVVNAKALESVLDGEPDRTDAFFGSGTRTFADGSVESTHHVFLIGKQADGKKYVYDPNDPGSPIPCRITDRAGGVEVQWVCRYRDTGNVTTQRYRIVQKDTFFRRMLDD